MPQENEIFSEMPAICLVGLKSSLISLAGPRDLTSSSITRSTIRHASTFGQLHNTFSLSLATLCITKNLDLELWTVARVQNGRKRKERNRDSGLMRAEIKQNSRWNFTGGMRSDMLITETLSSSEAFSSSRQRCLWNMQILRHYPFCFVRKIFCYISIYF